MVLPHRGAVRRSGHQISEAQVCNALASPPKGILQDILDTVDVCNEPHQPFDLLKDSGERKFSVWGRMLKRHRRRQEAFSLLESLLSGGGPLQSFGPPLQEIC